MTTTVTIVPFRQVDPVTLRIVRLEHAGGVELERVERRDDPTFGRREIDITQSGRWSEIDLSLEATVDEAELLKALGQAPDEVPRCTVLASIACRESKVRIGIPLRRVEQHRYVTSARLHREEVFGDIEIRVRIARSDELVPAHAGLGTHIGTLEGESDSVFVVVDDHARSYDGPVRFNWVDFANAPDELLVLRGHASRVAYVDTTTVPTVYVNTGIAHIRAALESTVRHGNAAVARDLLATFLAELAWVQLVVASLDAVDLSDDGELSIPSDWKGAVVRQFAQFAHPDEPMDGALALVANKWNTPGERAELSCSALMFAQSRADCKRRIERALRVAAASTEDS